MAEGYRDFAAAEVLTAANTDDYLMRQTVMRFASAAARDSALSGILTEGLCAYLKDVDQLTMYNGSAWVIVTSVGSMTSVDTTLLQFGTVAHTVTHHSYFRQGKLIKGNFNYVVTGSGTSANVVTITAPFNGFSGAGAGDVVGAGFIYDSSAAIKYRGLLVFDTAPAFKFLTLHSTVDGYLGTTDFTAGLASGDQVSGSYHYEAASASA